MKRLLLMVALVFAWVAVPAAPAGAGGGPPMAPTKDSYRPGETVALVGYTSTYFADQLAPMVQDPSRTPVVRLQRIDSFDREPVDLGEVGRPLVEATGHPGEYGFRISLALRLPADAPAGTYSVSVFLGDVFDGYFAVSVPLSHRSPVRWPTNEPARSQLAPEIPTVNYPPGTDNYISKAVRWPLTPIALGADAFTPAVQPAPTTTVAPPPPTTAATTTTTLAPTTTATQPAVRVTTEPAPRSRSNAALWIVVLCTAAVVAAAAGGYRLRRSVKPAVVERQDDPAGARPEPARDSVLR